MIVGTEESEAYKNKFIHMGYQLSADEVRAMLVDATSIKSAARKNNISYPTLKKYAKSYIDSHSGKTYFELFKNQAGKGVRKNFDKLKAYHNLENVLKEKQDPTPDRIAKLKEIVMHKKLLPMYCNKCGFMERRLTDMKVPLLLNFKNKLRSDWRLENLEFLCYNCYFLLIGDPLSSKIVRQIEAHEFDSELYKDKAEQFHQLDEVYLNHLRDLGLDDSGDIAENYNSVESAGDDGDDFIDFV